MNAYFPASFPLVRSLASVALVLGLVIVALVARLAGVLQP